ncbi:DUF4124 domain-containing protein [Halomonas sp. 328]|uniref:DUF4124 domain-containing protein n=1 Tax=Halomonas sp. 328 TaxID=2776704 RepID=UPI0018A7245B|nr:DUF4124 domain-containing protein [Halomonas sp. 328]MBF8223994.1 DUF4124 domain-containing protein [Halomonas sp. 328]
MKLRLVCLLLSCCLVPLAGADTVYRSVDAQGNVIFTDNPERGEPVQVAPLTVVPSRTLAPAPAASAQPAPRRPAPGSLASPFMPYSTFRIMNPRDAMTLSQARSQNLTVELAIEPGLRDDHRVRLLVDGQLSQSAMHTRAFIVPRLEPGQRTLQAELLDGAGQVRHRSPPVTVSVQARGD